MDGLNLDALVDWIKKTDRPETKDQLLIPTVDALYLAERCISRVGKYAPAKEHLIRRLGARPKMNCGAQIKVDVGEHASALPWRAAEEINCVSVQPKLPTRRSVLRGQDLGDDRHS